MFIAVNDKKEKIHISKAVKGNNYYCPICNEILRMNTGLQKAHYFSHLPNTLCKDFWKYDMSEWHFAWQEQFPMESQEVVFENDNEIHRADVFIKNTVIEFQHSPISEIDFDSRNNFYNKLGFKVIWIFDIQDKDIEYLGEGFDDIYRAFSWKYPIKFLEKVVSLKDKVTVFLQIDSNIWNEQENYKNIKDYNELKIKSNLIRIDKISYEGFKEFYSKDYFSDYEILDKFLSFNHANKKWYEYKIKTTNEILFDYLYFYNGAISDLCGYCPKYKKYIDYNQECHGCYNYVYKKHGCDFRFKDLPFEDMYLNDIKRNQEEKITKVDLTYNGKRTIYEIDNFPSYVRSIKDFIEINTNMRVVRFRNVKSGMKIQLDERNIQNIKEKNICKGKLCKYNGRTFEEEKDIFNWDKPEWELVWYKNKYEPYIRKENRTVMHELSKLNNYKK